MNCYIFPNDRKTNQTTYYWFKNGFNDDEIRKVKDYIKQYDFQESTVFSGSDKSVRDSKIKWIDCNSETEWLYQKIYDDIINNTVDFWIVAAGIHAKIFCNQIKQNNGQTEQ